MKRNFVILLAVIFLAGTAAIVLAGHEHMVIPYEGTFGHATMMPLPDAGDLRHHITGHTPYKKDFKLWPGKGEMYKGMEPHGSLLTTYVNDIALKSIKNRSGMTNNSIIVKENYSPDKKLMAVTVMYKVKGYNAEGGDWFWVKYGADFSTLASGKVKGCLGCHGSVANNDYVFTGKVR
jgi:hypothetical protein